MINRTYNCDNELQIAPRPTTFSSSTTLRGPQRIMGVVDELTPERADKFMAWQSSSPSPAVVDRDNPDLSSSSDDDFDFPRRPAPLNSDVSEFYGNYGTTLSSTLHDSPSKEGGKAAGKSFVQGGFFWDAQRGRCGRPPPTVGAATVVPPRLAGVHKLLTLHATISFLFFEIGGLLMGHFSERAHAYRLDLVFLLFGAVNLFAVGWIWYPGSGCLAASRRGENKPLVPGASAALRRLPSSGVVQAAERFQSPVMWEDVEERRRLTPTTVFAYSGGLCGGGCCVAAMRKYYGLWTILASMVLLVVATRCPLLMWGVAVAAVQKLVGALYQALSSSAEM